MSLFVQAPEDPARIAVLLTGEALLLSFIGADPGYVPSYRARIVEDDEQVEVSVQEVDGHQGFRTLVGHSRWAQAQLAAPLGSRRLVLDDGHLLPVAQSELLARLSGTWEVVGYDYQLSEDREPYWVTRYRSPGRSVMLAQGGSDLLPVDWQREFFRPVRLDQPQIDGRTGVLYTFVGEEGSNHVLAWPTDSGAMRLQLLGPAEPSELVELARGLSRAAEV